MWSVLYPGNILGSSGPHLPDSIFHHQPTDSFHFYLAEQKNPGLEPVLESGSDGLSRESIDLGGLMASRWPAEGTAAGSWWPGGKIFVAPDCYRNIFSHPLTVAHSHEMSQGNTAYAFSLSSRRSCKEAQEICRRTGGES